MSSSSGTASTVSAPRAAAQHRFRCHRPMSTDNHPAQPPSGVGLAGLREAAAGCRACELWEPATQTVFGEGPETARGVFVGEQPGDQEDRKGEPSVGRAATAAKALISPSFRITKDRGHLIPWTPPGAATADDDEDAPHQAWMLA